MCLHGTFPSVNKNIAILTEDLLSRTDGIFASIHHNNEIRSTCVLTDPIDPLENLLNHHTLHENILAT